MNSKSVFPFFGWLLALLAFALVATGPLLAFGYRLVVITVAPALQAANLAAVGH